MRAHGPAVRSTTTTAPFYVRVLPRNRSDRGSSADVFRNVGPYVAHRRARGPVDGCPVLVLLPLRRVGAACSWRATSSRRHEGDWEAVTIGLARNKAAVRRLLRTLRRHVARMVSRSGPGGSHPGRPWHTPSSRWRRARRPTTRGPRCAGLPTGTAAPGSPALPPISSATPPTSATGPATTGSGSLAA